MIAISKRTVNLHPIVLIICPCQNQRRTRKSLLRMARSVADCMQFCSKPLICDGVILQQ